MRTLLFTLTLLCMANVAGPAYADGGDRNPSAGQAVINAAFSAAERETIHQYFLRHPDQLRAIEQVDEYAHEGYQDEEQDSRGDRGDDNEDYGNDEDRDREANDRGHGHGHEHGHGWKSEAGGLPPGIAKNLRRGKPLPPGIAGQMRPLPEALARELPPPPRGYKLVIVDGKVLLIDAATQVIHDVIANAVMGDNPDRHD